MILNRQKKVRLATRPLQAFLRKAQHQLNIADAELTIAFVSDDEIARWNDAYRRKLGPTDVLSFPATSGALNSNGCLRARAKRSDSGSSPRAAPHSPLVYPDRVGATHHSSLFLGDIAIAPETARRYAKKNGRTLGSEIRVLMLHGILHLMGYDHEGDKGQMNRIERKLRRRLGIA